MARTNYKPIILISGLLVLGLGGYYLYQTKFKKKEDEVPEPEITAAETQSPVVAPSPKPKKTVVINIPAPVRTAPGFVKPPSGPQSVAVKTPAIGDHLYVLTDGANAYKTAQAATANIYKYYHHGVFVGTYLAKSGIFTKLIVQEKNIFGIPGNVPVFVRSTEIYAK